MPPIKKISSIVVNWNDKETLKRCLTSLQKQDHPNLEIIVSDNGSTDGSQEMTREEFPDVLLLENNANLGFGTAVNRGFERASGDFLIFLNNDLEFAPESLSALMKQLEDSPGLGGTVPKILYSQKPEIINSYGVNIHYTGIACPHLVDQPDRTHLEPSETACAGIALISRGMYEDIGGFDEGLFLYHEDHDLSWRGRLSGWHLATCPSAIFYHRYHFNKGTMKYYHSEKNRLYLLLKNLELKTLILLSPALLMTEAAQWAHSLLNGWFLLKLKSYRDLFDQLPQILVKRRKVQSSRKVPDCEIIRLYQADLAVSGVQSFILDRLLNPLYRLYWKMVSPWI